ncbi:MAG: 16S rRNA (guanine(527)-N(7))-methyltransferase RsmG [Rhodobacteraceae bacterium]|nr:16S rRNA (guanine(527)-N(7))-methyltransferase RsmG [Paracoccaceae bacterium]
MGAGAGDFGADVSRETVARLETYAALLRKWNPAINLVSKSTLDDLWTRHFADSAQILSLSPVQRGHWVDMGSGGGFPGAVVAILAHELAPGLRITCIESDQRKATFLRTVARETSVDFEVISQRIEEVPPQNADIVSARALAPLPLLLEFAERHLKSGGTAVFHKGVKAVDEMAKALETWRFTSETFPSGTDPAASILKLGEIARV